VPIERLIVDTGPLVSFLDRTQEHHEWARERFREVTGSLITCEAVLAEAFHILRNRPVALAALGEMLAARAFDLKFHVEDWLPALPELMARYSNVPMSFADASLVVLSEVVADAPVLTLDSDFLIYRRFGSEPLPLVTPFIR
jgi:predicted nucleic acid-binding protein